MHYLFTCCCCWCRCWSIFFQPATEPSQSSWSRLSSRPWLTSQWRINLSGDRAGRWRPWVELLWVNCWVTTDWVEAQWRSIGDISWAADPWQYCTWPGSSPFQCRRVASLGGWAGSQKTSLQRMAGPRERLGSSQSCCFVSPSVSQPVTTGGGGGLGGVIGGLLLMVMCGPGVGLGGGDSGLWLQSVWVSRTVWS